MNKYRNNGIIRVVIFLLVHIIIGILIQIGAAYALEGVMTSYEGFANASADYGEMIDKMSAPNPGMIVYVSIVAPMIEELVFRLGLIGLGRKFVNFWIINAISSILFGIYHGNWVQGIYACLLGFVLGIIFQYSKGYISSALVHITINIGGLYLAPLLQSMNTPIQNLLVGLFFLAATGIIIWIMIAKTNREIIKVPVV